MYKLFSKQYGAKNWRLIMKGTKADCIAYAKKLSQVQDASFKIVKRETQITYICFCWD